MSISLKSFIVSVGLAMSLFACTDHRLGGVLSPARLRLKTAEAGSLNSTYTYDSQNRLATLSKNDGSLGVYKYDDVNKYAELRQYVNPADQTSGVHITFPYSFDGTDFTSTTYTFNSYNYFGNTVDVARYSFDPNNKGHIIYVARNTLSPGIDQRSYQYTGENITKRRFSQGRILYGDKVYEYDNKINPFFGSTDPDIDDIQRFSRNNVVKTTLSPPIGTSGIPDQITVYEYEYNSQGLPTKRTIKQGGTEVITYTYEAY